MKSPDLVQLRILHAASFLLGICFARSFYYPEDWPLLQAISSKVLAVAIGAELIFRCVKIPMMGVLVLLGLAWGSLRFQRLETLKGRPNQAVLKAQCLEPLSESKSTYWVQVEGFPHPLSMKLREGDLQPGSVFPLAAEQIKPLRCKGHEPGRFCYARWSLDHGQAFSIYVNGPIRVPRREKLPGIYRIRTAIKARLYQRTSAEVRPWALALVLGDKGQFESQEIKRVQDFGLMHVLAISGLHVGMFFQCLKWVLRLLPLGLRWMRIGEVMLLLLVWGYAALCHMVPSVLRASLFITWFVWGRSVLQRPTEAQFVWPIAMLIQLLIRPQDAFDMGFQLSYMATAALFYLVPMVNVKKSWIKMMFVAWVCAILSFPILVFASGHFSLGFWLGAMGLAPLLGLIIPLFWIGLWLPPNFFWMENDAMRVFLFVWERIPNSIIQYWQLKSFSVYDACWLQCALVYFVFRLTKLFFNSNT